MRERYVQRVVLGSFVHLFNLSHSYSYSYLTQIPFFFVVVVALCPTMSCCSIVDGWLAGRVQKKREILAACQLLLTGECQSGTCVLIRCQKREKIEEQEQESSTFLLPFRVFFFFF